MDVNITEHDKEVIEKMVNDLSGHLKIATEEGQTDKIFDNTTLDIYMKNLILTLNDIRNDGNISKYVGADGSFKVLVE
ncbi:MAG: hypothetical protein ABSF14_23830 [Terriglobia bacterium]|jgi:hypothetical protein